MTSERTSPIAFSSALPSEWIGLAHQGREQRITPELFVIVEVLVAQGDTVNALRDHARVELRLYPTATGTLE